LVIGWGTSVKIASIRANQHGATNGTYRHVPMSSMNQVDIVASFQTSYFISGVAPFGDSLVVLAYIPGEEDGEKELVAPFHHGRYFLPYLFVKYIGIPFLSLCLVDSKFKLQMFCLSLETKA